MSKDKALTVKEDTTTALSTMLADFGADAGSGFEEATGSSYAIPFLKLLAAMSKQCKKGTGEYLKGAEEGQFWNSVSNELFDGEVGLDIIPVHFTPKFIEYEGTVDEGGGFVRAMSLAEGTKLAATVQRDSDGNDRLPRSADGKNHILVDIREHYLLALRPGTTEVMPCLLSLTSSGIPVSKNWMSMMGQFKRNPAQPGPDPMFSHIFHLTSYMKPSKKVDSMYATYKITHVCPIESAPYDPAVVAGLYQAAKAFKEQLALGQVQTPSYEEPTTHSDDAPF